jgi:hypothetical protein
MLKVARYSFWASRIMVINLWGKGPYVKERRKPAPAAIFFCCLACSCFPLYAISSFFFGCLRLTMIGRIEFELEASSLRAWLLSG